ncbi:hypothetical protein F5B20DRAFT_178678 [Whalleya microplaca]|nr:hypothetical protein F5B20DRAFT_178678 [Whalleya microplaca]
MPGFLNEANPAVYVLVGATRVYSLNFLLGFVLASVLAYILHVIFPVHYPAISTLEEQQRSERIDISDDADESIGKAVERRASQEPSCQISISPRHTSTVLWACNLS